MVPIRRISSLGMNLENLTNLFWRFRLGSVLYVAQIGTGEGNYDSIWSTTPTPAAAPKIVCKLGTLKGIVDKVQQPPKSLFNQLNI